MKELFNRLGSDRFNQLIENIDIIGNYEEDYDTEKYTLVDELRTLTDTDELSEELINKCRNTFIILDRNNDGDITSAEFNYIEDNQEKYLMCNEQSYLRNEKFMNKIKEVLENY